MQRRAAAVVATRWRAAAVGATRWRAAVLSARRRTHEARATNAAWNGGLAAGATTTFGFIAEGTAGTPTLTCTAA